MDEGETLERLVQELVDAMGEAEAAMGEAMDVARAVAADGAAATAADETADTAADGVISGS
ncbi:hypothetical protein GCM10010277_81350 [Streptomyces longisporoflavus]|uniref:hypothetical protein n=1 Tax=Streptomyces longisporoflavus TaxID=28044 RepID=UPI00167D33C3|nr:hypothetical protein [Streptomyces longisporoflavus]GGV70407.1 hypothetical protein GCM10010277_81350 [Streptomyces longisporoflavus]